MRLSTFLAECKPASLAAIKTVSHDIAKASRQRHMIHLVERRSK